MSQSKIEAPAPVGGEIPIDWSRCPHAPWAHQQHGIRTLLERPAFLLMDDVGAGKSLQVTATACALYEAGVIDALLVVTPAFARSVWASPDPLLGEFAKHAWFNTYYNITEYSAKTPKLPKPLPHYAMGRQLDVVVTNYELIRRDNHRNPLVQWAAARRTWLVLDESWAVKNPQAKQAKACYLLRQACERVTLLNGTPGAPEELFTQFQILDSSILGVKNFFHFRAKFCIVGDVAGYKKIVGYQRQEEFAERTRPYVLRREAKDCLDLPPVLPPLTIEARLNDIEWKHYTQMRDELVVWLSSDAASIARQAGVRTLRLAQILAGFLGGVEEFHADEVTLADDGGDGERDVVGGDRDDRVVGRLPSVREIGRAKLDAVLAWLAGQDVHKVVVWAKFRAEMGRAAAAFAESGRVVHLLQGQQAPDERLAAKMSFAPGSSESRPAVLVGHPAAGGAGINLAAANLAIYMSQGWSLKDRLQSEGRLNRPGQTQPVRFVDVVAVGPNNQRTLDHAILAALRGKLDVATFTAKQWTQVLMDE